MLDKAIAKDRSISMLYAQGHLFGFHGELTHMCSKFLRESIVSKNTSTQANQNTLRLWYVILFQHLLVLMSVTGLTSTN